MEAYCPGWVHTHSAMLLRRDAYCTTWPGCIRPRLDACGGPRCIRPPPLEWLGGPGGPRKVGPGEEARGWGGSHSESGGRMHLESPHATSRDRMRPAGVVCILLRQYASSRGSIHPSYCLLPIETIVLLVAYWLSLRKIVKSRRA